MCELRGNGRPGTAGGAFACLCPDEEGKVVVDPSPVDVAAAKTADQALPSEEAVDEGDEEDEEQEEESPLFFPEKASGTQMKKTSTKKRKTSELAARFGPAANPKRAKLDRVTAKIQDICRPQGQERSSIQAAQASVTFAGADVHAGLRALAERGVLDLARMPGWMAGEEGRSVIAV